MKTQLPLEVILDSPNVADLLHDDDLLEIGQQVVKGYEIDEESRAEWKEIIDKAMEVAKQVMGPAKTYPWPGASNIKYPLITDACINFGSRVMPEIIQGNRVVKAGTVGKDPDEAKYRRSDRVSRAMSYQLVCENKEWERGTDSLLHILPVLGTVFRKTYYDAVDKRFIAEVCTPDKIVVNYEISGLEKARRVTHVLTRYQNDIIERQRLGVYKDIPLEELQSSEYNYEDNDYPICLLEQHCWYDLDGDGYKEPYIVIVHKESRKVLRIVNRIKDVVRNQLGQISKIWPIHYFTDYHFIPSPDGGFYSLGFGALLLPLNKAVDSLINMLIDAGTLSNTQAGFLGRSLRLKNGEFKFKMGEWMVLDAASGTNISQNVVPLPVREPSQTLLSLLTLLIQIGKDLSSTTDALEGKQPAQNVAQGTYNMLIEQGTKVFNAVSQRIHRSLKEEFKKLYDLNYEFLDQQYYQNILDDPEADVKKDFEPKSLDIFPVADPILSTETQRLQKAGVVMNLPTVDPRAAASYMLRSMQLDEEEIQRLIPPPDPNAPPPPEVEKIMSEVRLNDAKVAEVAAKAHLDITTLEQAKEKLRQDIRESNARISEGQARAWKMGEDVLSKRRQLDIAAGKMVSQAQQNAAEFKHKQQIDIADKQIQASSEETKAAKVAVDAELEAARIAVEKQQADKEERANKET